MINKVFKLFFPKPLTDLERMILLIEKTKTIKSLTGSIENDHLFTLDDIIVGFSFKGDRVIIKKNNEIVFVSDQLEEIKEIFNAILAVSLELQDA